VERGELSASGARAVRTMVRKQAGSEAGPS